MIQSYWHLTSDEDVAGKRASKGVGIINADSGRALFGASRTKRSTIDGSNRSRNCFAEIWAELGLGDGGSLIRGETFDRRWAEFYMRRTKNHRIEIDAVGPLRVSPRGASHLSTGASSSRMATCISYALESMLRRSDCQFQ